jgi:DNA end-binding protein Ku
MAHTAIQTKEKALRSSWSGSLSFGLVHIPIKLYSASTEKGLQFKLLDKNGNCPISYVRVCRADHREVPAEDVVKGYEYQKGDYVVLDEKDFRKALPGKTGVVEILQFSDISEIEPKYFEKPYYVVPDKKSAKAYLLLRDALKNTKKVAIAQFTMKDRQHIAALVADGNHIILHQLRYAEEIKNPSEVGMLRGGKYMDKEMKTAESLIKGLTKPFDPKKYKDAYTEGLEEVIEAKIKGKKVRTPARPKTPEPTDMKDLMRLLKKSLEKELVNA